MVPKLEHIESMFADVRNSGTNVDGDLRWTFSFLDTDGRRLAHYATELSGAGFSAGPMESNEASTVFRVCIFQVMTHTPASLYAALSKFQADVEAGMVAQLDGIDMRPDDAA